MGIGIHVHHMFSFFRSTLVSQLVFWRVVALPDAPLALQHLPSLGTRVLRLLPVLHPAALPLSTSQQWRCLSRLYATCA